MWGLAMVATYILTKEGEGGVRRQETHSISLEIQRDRGREEGRGRE